MQEPRATSKKKGGGEEEEEGMETKRSSVMSDCLRQDFWQEHRSTMRKVK